MATAETSWLENVDREEYPQLQNELRVDVAIVGGGLAGVLTAYALTKAGKKVALLESNQLGTGATAYTTAFITQVIDTPLYRLITLFGEAQAKQIWEAGSKAIDYIEAAAREESIDCGFARVPAYIFALTGKQHDEIERELGAIRQLGFSGNMLRTDELWFENCGALHIPNQAKFHPLRFLVGVAAAAAKRGALIFENSAVTDIAGLNPIILTTKSGKVRAEHVIIATYKPFRNPKATRFKKGMYKSYVLELETKEDLPEGLYWDLHAPYHYFRIDKINNGQKTRRQIIIGGEDHRVEFKIREKKNFAALEKYAAQILTGKPYSISKRWAGLVLEPSDGLALIGEFSPNYFLASAFSGNGMTYSAIAAMLFTDLIVTKKENPWAVFFDPKRIASLKQVLGKGIDYTREFFGAAVKNFLK